MSSLPTAQHSQLRSGNSHKNAKRCRFCFRSFSKVEHLTRHERAHTKERPFQCNRCGKSYGRHDTLMRHQKVHEKSRAAPVSPSDYDGESSSSRADNAAAVLVDLQSLPSRQNDSRNDYDSRDMSYMGGPHSTVSTAEMPQVDQNLNGGGPQRMDNSPSFGFPSAVVVDTDAQYLVHNGQPRTFPFSSTGLWSMENEPFPSWHIGDDFDLNAFNTSLLSPVFVDHNHASATQPQNIVEPTTEIQNPGAPSISIIQDLWVTKTDNNCRKTAGISYSVAPTRQTTPARDSQPHKTVDDRYREDLSQRLRPRWKEDPLPSTEFLNLALKLFFTKFNPILPILHEPTFHPSNQNSLLLLSICSIGSLFMGSTGATAQGSKIFERLNKVILASWENIVTRESSERISMVQAAVIGQTFAYVSGNPKHLAIAEVFHGSVIAWARSSGVFTTIQSLPHLDNELPHELEDIWNAWARSEEMTRTGLALYIHDSLLASMFHHDPVLKHNAIQLSVAANNNVFAASNAVQWAQLVRQSTSETTRLRSHLHTNQHEHNCLEPLFEEVACKSSRFSCYVLLHGIGAAIQESIAVGKRSPADMQKYQDALICWYYAYEENQGHPQPDNFCLIVLWHEIFMSLLVDFNELERAVGRDGPAEAEDALRYVGQWTSTIEAKRCLVHASLIYRHIASMRVDWEPSIHVPRSMFLAGIVWYCYIQFGREDHAATQDLGEAQDTPEFKIFNIHPLQHLFEASGFKKGKPKVTEASSLCGLTDMLQRIGHWGISKKFGRILAFLIHEDIDAN